jgi:guanine nucleotide-binding protein subunit alpha
VEPDEPPILDSAAYFLDAAPRCLAADYSPTNADMLRARLRTTGVTEYRLDFGSAHGSPDSFAFIDVGGQRGERRKWINAFSDVSALFYIASLSEYDQQLPEARERNRLSESLALFESLLSQRWFERVPVILFLNKYDLFVLKAREVDLGDSFPEYAGGLDEVAALKWIRDQYEAKANLPAVRARRRGKGAEKIYTHVTTATDTQGIAFVWKAVRDAVVTKSLDEFGMSLV